MKGLSIIIPTLNEATLIRRCLASVMMPGSEVIVVDGGSTDHTRGYATDAGATVIQAACGRGQQFRAGVEAASGHSLLFLHADSFLEPTAPDVITAALNDSSFAIGTFRLRFDSPRIGYRLYTLFSRVESLYTTFGDQGILVRRGFYEWIGGFPAWSILEDVELLRRARQITRIQQLPATITTSVRRFEKRGLLRQQLLNATILFRYLLHNNPEELARMYSNGL